MQNMNQRQRELYDKVKNASGQLELDGKKIGRAEAQAIAEALKVNTTLKELSLGDNKIGDAGVHAIAEALKVNKALKNLFLHQNQIDDAGAQAIAEALKVNTTTLTTLHLGDNKIGDAGAHAIAETLKVNTTLTGLSLGDNKIGVAGAQAIAEALKVNTTLTELGLQVNQIGDAGAQAIAEALKVNTTLTLLILQENQIGDAGAHAIAEALKVNTTLTELGLDYNQIGDAGAQAISEALEVNKTLNGLHLSQNFLTKAGIAALRQTGNTICKFDHDFGKLDKQRVPSPADLAQIAARASANVAEIQQLRAKLAAKDQALAAQDQELATKELELQSALDRIAVLERNQASCGSFSNFDGPIPQVPLATLVSATNNFAADSLVGEGAFGRVYGASLPGPTVPVAIKKLSAESIQGYVSFQAEVNSLSKFRHPNIIAMLSFAEAQSEYCLVYEFMPNGSVRDRLNLKNNTPALTWSQRHRIAADVARGMHYVQTAFPDHVLFHLDLKTDNVLLDAHFNAKVSDFGLVRVAQLDDKSYLRTSNVQGSKAYMCPVFFGESKITIKTDVYAFGMILLELVTAAKPGPTLKTDVRKAVKTQKFVEMLDSALKPSEAELQSISELVTLALECLDEAADDRPSFGQLIAQLDT